VQQHVTLFNFFFTKYVSKGHKDKKIEKRIFLLITMSQLETTATVVGSYKEPVNLSNSVKALEIEEKKFLGDIFKLQSEHDSIIKENEKLSKEREQLEKKLKELEEKFKRNESLLMVKKIAIGIAQKNASDIQQEKDVSKTLLKIGTDIGTMYNDMLYTGKDKASSSEMGPRVEDALMSCARPVTKIDAAEYRENMYTAHMCKTSDVKQMELFPPQMKAIADLMLKGISEKTKLNPIADSKKVEITVSDASGKIVLRTKASNITLGRLLTTNDIVTPNVVDNATRMDISRLNTIVSVMSDPRSKRIVFVITDFWSVVGTRVFDGQKEIGASMLTPSGDGRSLIIVVGNSFTLGMGGVDDTKPIHYTFTASTRGM
jgi:regulator of replication initiation timing